MWPPTPVVVVIPPPPPVPAFPGGGGGALTPAHATIEMEPASARKTAALITAYLRKLLLG
jgi:hypothetical protein